ncbi:MAG: helix-turn-helix domain-containing protein [Bacteroidota bacterium]
MRNISELFEFLSHCDKETLFTELNIHCDRLLKNKGTESTKLFKFDIENLNTLCRMSEWYLGNELSRMIEDKNSNSEKDEIMTVEETALYTKTTSAHIYNLVDKGKLKSADFSTIDKPGARKLIRIRKSEIDGFFNGK